MRPGRFRLSRRHLLALGLSAPLGPVRADTPDAPPVLAPRTLQFPLDLGSHPDFLIEWWYLTGHVRTTPNARQFGFQVTFFRSRVPSTQGMTSAFAARQLLFAHAAVTDVTGQTHWHDQRAARTGFGLAQADTHDTRINLLDWSLLRDASGYKTTVVSEEFRFDLTLRETQPLLLQGQQGLSRKGPQAQAQQASFYYSLPQLQVNGILARAGQTLSMQGAAWLDHEWSQAFLHPSAVGWDWIGMNLLDGSALTAFRLRTQSGQSLWDGGSWRADGGTSSAQVFPQGSVTFQPVRYWSSPLSQARYPVEWRLHTPAGRYTVKAVINHQKLDSRSSTGAIYWEGLSDLLDEQGQRIGRGYLEMTGYASPLRL